MKKLLLFLLVIGAMPVLAQDSVADAARASKQKTTTAKRIITEDEMPSRGTSGGSGGVVDLDGSWGSDLDRVRMAYKQLCSDPTLHDAKSLPASKQKYIDEAMAPLRARIAREEDNMKVIKARLERMDQEEQNEVASAGSDKQRVAEIHAHYTEMRNKDKEKIATTMQIAGAVYKEMMSIASECMQSAKQAPSEGN